MIFININKQMKLIIIGSLILSEIRAAILICMGHQECCDYDGTDLNNIFHRCAQRIIGQCEAYPVYTDPLTTNEVCQAASGTRGCANNPYTSINPNTINFVFNLNSGVQNVYSSYQNLYNNGKHPQCLPTEPCQIYSIDANSVKTQVQPNNPFLISITSMGQISVNTDQVTNGYIQDFQALCWNTYQLPENKKVYSQSFKIQVGNPQCDTTVTITEGSYQNGLGANQYVQANDLNGPTQFELPAFTISDTTCAISSVELTSSATSIVPVTGMGTPAQTATAGIWSVAPQDILQDNVEFSGFYAVVTIDGGSSVTIGPLSLMVGCAQGAFTIADDGGLILNPSISVSSVAPNNQYTFTPPTISPVLSYCTLTQNILTNVEVNGVSSSSGAILTTGCTQPCTIIDINTDVLQTVTFNVQSTINGGQQWTSALITVAVTCTSATIVEPSSLSFSQQYEVIPTSTIQSFIFDAFTCTVQECCASITYGLSSTSGSMTAFQDNGIAVVVDSPAVGKVSINIDASIKYIYQFFIEVQNIEQTGIHYTSQITLDVACSANSVTGVTETLTNANDQYQNISPNVADPLYQVNVFDSDNSQCPTISYSISSTNVEPVAAPSTLTFSGVDKIARPVDPTLHTIYQFYIAIQAEGSTVNYFSNLKTLIVGCVAGYSSITLDTTVTLTYSMDVGIIAPANTITYPVPTSFAPAYCPITEYALVEQTVNGVLTVGGGSSICTAQPCRDITIDTSAEQQVQFKLEVKNAATTVISDMFSVSVTCSSSITITPPADIQSVYQLIHLDASNTISFSPFDCSVPACCLMNTYTYRIAQSVTADVDPTIQAPIFDSMSNIFTSIVDTSQVLSKTVYLVVDNNKGSFVIHSFQIQIVCGPQSSVLNENNYTAPLTSVQFVQKSNQGQSPTRFQLPEFKASYTPCPIMSMLPSFTSNIFSQMLELTASSTYDYVVPVDIAIDADYTFYLKIMVDGSPTEYYSSKMKLVVGCSQAVSVHFDITKFVTSLVLDQGANGVEAYKFEPPALQLSYCPILSYQIVDLKVDGELSQTGAQICQNQPSCSTVSLSTSNIQITKFKVLAIIKGEASSLSPEVTATIKAVKNLTQSFVDDLLSRQNQTQNSTEKNETIQTIIKPSLPQVNDTSKPKLIFNITKEPVVQKNIKSSWVRNFTCSLSEFDSNGRITVSFSEKMKDQNDGFDVQKMIKNETFEMKIIPSGDTQEVMKEYDDEFLSFYWYPLSFIDKELILQVVFKYPLNISSSGPVRDRLKITTKQPEIFKTGNPQQNLDQASWVQYQYIKKQMMKDGISASLSKADGPVKAAMNSVAVANMGLNVALSASMNQFLGALNALQIMTYQSMINVEYPGNSQFLISCLQNVLNVDLFDPEWTTELVFDFEKDEELVKQIPNTDNDSKRLLQEEFEQDESTQHTSILIDQIKDMGFETFNPILNMGGLFVITFLYLLQFLLAFFFYICSFRSQYFLKKYKSLMQKLLFNYGLILIYESLIQFSMSSILFLERPAIDGNSSFTEKFSQIYGYLCPILTFLVLPTLAIYLIVVDDDRLNDARLKQRIGVLYETLDTSERFKMAYCLIFILRRIILCLISAFFSSYPSIQVQLLNYLNLLVYIYIGKAQPFNDRILNRNEIVNEYLITILTVHLFCFTQFVPDLNAQYQIGFSFIFVIFAAIFYNMGQILYSMLKKLYLQLKRFYNRMNCKIKKRSSIQSNEECQKQQVPPVNNPNLGAVAAFFPVQDAQQEEKKENIIEQQVELKTKNPEFVYQPVFEKHQKAAEKLFGNIVQEESKESGSFCKNDIFEEKYEEKVEEKPIQDTNRRINQIKPIIKVYDQDELNDNLSNLLQNNEFDLIEKRQTLFTLRRHYTLQLSLDYFKRIVSGHEIEKVVNFIDPEQLPQKYLQTEKLYLFYRFNTFNYLRTQYENQFLPMMYNMYQMGAIKTLDNILTKKQYELENIELLHQKFKISILQQLQQLDKSQQQIERQYRTIMRNYYPFEVQGEHIFNINYEKFLADAFEGHCFKNQHDIDGFWDSEEIQIIGSLNTDGRIGQLYEFFKDQTNGKDLYEQSLAFIEFKQRVEKLYSFILSQHDRAIKLFQDEISQHQIEMNKEKQKILQKLEVRNDKDLRDYLLNIQIFELIDNIKTNNFVIATLDELSDLF